MSEVKQRLVEVTGDELSAILATENLLCVPHLMSDLVLRSGPQKYYADADELRVWRASQHTSGATHE
jgi:hypothetical protein